MAILKGTRAAQILIGMLVILSAYAISSFFQLETLNWIISKFYTYFIFFVIVVFQDDIRRIFLRFGRSPFATGLDEQSGLHVIEEVINAVKYMSHDRLGALLVFERGVGLERLHDHSKKLDANVSEQLLICIFQSFSPLHDGAVIIHKNKIICASAQLPLTKNPVISKKLGTRHSAAVGITEETDAVVLVVSEETGGISVAWDGHIQKQLSPEAAKRMLTSMLMPNYDKDKANLGDDAWLTVFVQKIGFGLRSIVKKPTVYRGDERRKKAGDRRDRATDPRSRKDSASDDNSIHLRFSSDAPRKHAKISGDGLFVLGQRRNHNESKDTMASFEEVPFESELGEGSFDERERDESLMNLDEEESENYGQNEAAKALSHMRPEDKLDPPTIPMPPPQDISIGGVSIESPMDTTNKDKTDKKVDE